MKKEVYFYFSLTTVIALLTSIGNGVVALGFVDVYEKSTFKNWIGLLIFSSLGFFSLYFSPLVTTTQVRNHFTYYQ
jgi:hypothetical protein